MSRAYYNEFDPVAAAWLRELIKCELIAPGEVDERSIVDVEPSDLEGFTQCHFFAGIGGWSYALRLAGWPDARPVWTGSCPCQPFSGAGRGKGTADERHLWPALARLIRECRPAIAFGEQVASPAGRGWLAAVRDDLEGLGYAVGAADLCAAGVGAPHIRQRVYWVADGGVGDSEHAGREGRPIHLPERGSLEARVLPDGAGATGGVVDRLGAGLEGLARSGDDRDEPGRVEQNATRSVAEAGTTGRPDAPDSRWRTADWLACRDDRWRPVEPGTFPLADGVPARVGRLRGYGNAIVPQVAATFVRACM